MEKRIFKYLVNQCAFIDTVRSSVWTDNKPVLGQLVDERNDPIGSKASKYSRCLSGKAPISGNPTTVLYGRRVRFPNVPPFRIRMDSKEVPVTGAQVNEIVRRIFPDAVKIQVTHADMTFDLRRKSVGKLFRSVMHRARQWTELSNTEGKTTYVGSASSAWQIRIYDKVPDVVRFEVIFRRPFLYGYGVGRPDSLITLRAVPLPQMFSLRRVSRARVAEQTKEWEPEWRDMVLDWEIFRLPLPLLRRMLGLRDEEVDLVFPRSRLQRTLESMQKNLVW